MAWTSVGIFQGGNSTATYTMGPHASLSTHDAVVVRHDGGSSGIRLHWVEVRRDPTPRYRMRVQVVGAAPVAFRFSAERMN